MASKLESYIIKGLRAYGHSASTFMPSVHLNIKRDINDAKNKLKELKSKEKISLFLGAGISIPYNIPSWNNLLNSVLIKEENLGKNIETSLFNYIKGFNPLISARYLRIKNKISFENGIRNNLYKDLDYALTSPLVNSIIKLAKLPNTVSNIITYNYDDILETSFNKALINFNSIYGPKFEKIDNENINIFHVHGFLPRKGKLNKKANFITLSEDDYHNQYLNLYSWQNLIQIENFQNKHCLFIGTSLSDPNVRRLLDIANSNCHNNKNHYLFKVKYSDKDVENAIKRLRLESETAGLTAVVSEIDDFNKPTNIKYIQELLIKFDDLDTKSLNIKCLWFENHDEWSTFLDDIS
ncbi:MAG: SIR2 family protein [Saprospiraceae bacterium]|nr:SIR2 family protein [Saprospiraceae bacterium]